MSLIKSVLQWTLDTSCMLAYGIAILFTNDMANLLPRHTFTYWLCVLSWGGMVGWLVHCRAAQGEEKSCKERAAFHQARATALTENIALKCGVIEFHKKRMRNFFEGAGYQQINKLMTGSIGDFYRVGCAQAAAVEKITKIHQETQQQRDELVAFLDRLVNGSDVDHLMCMVEAKELLAKMKGGDA